MIIQRRNLLIPILTERSYIVQRNGLEHFVSHFTKLADCFRLWKGVHIPLVKLTYYCGNASDSNYPSSPVRLGHVYEKGNGTVEEKERDA